MKVGIVGTGAVGSSAAYAMILGGTASELVLIDPNLGLARAQAEDLEDATLFASPMAIATGDYSGLAGAEVVALCCGARQLPGETRLQLLGRNQAIFQQIVGQVVQHAPEAVLVVVSNPVDVLTGLVCKLAGLPTGRVFGTGTLLDTARFRAHLGQAVGVSPQSIHAYVLGEHGDSEVLIWSTVAVAGIPLEAFAQQVGRPLSSELKARIDDGVRNAAARIILGKGSTSYGIGAGIAQIVRAIRDNQGVVLTLSAPSRELGGEGAPCLSLPRVLGARGITRTLFPVLAAGERQALEQSARILRQAGEVTPVAAI
jgi:L-lactate dehydrogenase